MWSKPSCTSAGISGTGHDKVRYWEGSKPGESKIRTVSTFKVSAVVLHLDYKTSNKAISVPLVYSDCNIN